MKPGHGNRTIWFMWLQGLESAPAVVRACHDSWVRHHPEWRVELVTAEELSRLVEVPAWAFERLDDTHLSDLVRLRLLERHGGVWVDATAYCNWSLDSWLDLVDGSGFFAFARPDHGFLLSSWFLAAEAGHPLVRETRRVLERYWSATRPASPNPASRLAGRVTGRALQASVATSRWRLNVPLSNLLRIEPYFAFHHAFATAVHTDPVLARAWAEVPEVSSDGPHLVQRFGLERPVDEALRTELLDPTTPLYKLSWKETAGMNRPDSALSFLLSTATDR